MRRPDTAARCHYSAPYPSSVTVSAEGGGNETQTFGGVLILLFIVILICSRAVTMIKRSMKIKNPGLPTPLFSPRPRELVALGRSVMQS